MKTLEIRSVNYKFLLNSYREWLQIKGYSKTTVECSSNDVKEFFHFLEKQNVLHINKIESKHSAEFKTYLQYRKNYGYNTGGLSIGRINKILISLNNFGNYINETKEQFTIDIHQKPLPNQTAERIVLTQDEIKAIYFTTFDSYPYSLGWLQMQKRDRVILAVFYGCGLRRNEGINLNLSDIDFDNKTILVRKGKGYKQRYVPIPNKHVEDIKDYIQNSRYWFQENHHTNVNGYKYSVKKKTTRDDNEALILSIRGSRMKSFDERLRFLTKRTLIDKPVRTHVLRHSLATHLLQNGMELENIGKILGHSKIDTTQIYVHITEQLKQTEYTNDDN